MKKIQLIFGHSGLWAHEYTPETGKKVKEDNIEFIGNIMYFDGKPVFKVKLTIFKIVPFTFELQKFSLHRRVIHSVETITIDDEGCTGIDNLGNKLVYYPK